MSSNQLISFLQYLKTIKHYSSATIDNYQRDLNKFQDYLHTHPQAHSHDNISDKTLIDIIDAKNDDVRAYIAYRHRQGLASTSLQRQLSSLRSFYNYCLKEDIISTNPAFDVRAPKGKKKLPDVMDVDQVSHLLSAKPEQPLQIRDFAMMELMYSSGLRLSECVNLDVEDIDLEVPELKVTGKGNKTRYLPIGRAAVKALKRWYSVRTQMVKENERAVFISQRGVRLSQRTVQSRVQLAARQCGLGMHLHPHMLRHSFASHILQSSGDLRSLQELLGHANISTTQVYTQLDFQHLAKVYDDAHPRAKKKSD